MRRRLVLAALAGIAAGPAAADARRPVSSAEAKERYLLAQLAVSVRGWIRIEGRRQANGVASEEAAVAAVRGRWPDLSPKDAETMAFLVLMVALRDAEADIRIPNPPLMVIEELQARRDRLQAILAIMTPRISDIASPALRALR